MWVILKYECYHQNFDGEVKVWPLACDFVFKTEEEAKEYSKENLLSNFYKYRQLEAWPIE